MFKKCNISNILIGLVFTIHLLLFLDEASIYRIIKKETKNFNDLQQFFQVCVKQFS